MVTFTDKFIQYYSNQYYLNILAFGFLAGKEIQAEGSANAGLRDRKRSIYIGAKPSSGES